MKVLVYGSRMFGQVIRCLVEDCGREFAGFIDDVHEGEGVLGPFSSVRLTHSPSEYVCVNAVGYSDLAARRTVTARIQDAGYTMPVLVHPRAYVSAASSVGPGSFVMAGALVDCRVALADNVVVWPGVGGVLDTPHAVNAVTPRTSRPSGRARSGTHRNLTFVPRPFRTAAKRPLRRGTCIAIPARLDGWNSLMPCAR